MKNKALDILTHRVTLLSIMSVEFTRFERLKEEYESYLEFEEIYMTLRYENNRVIYGYHFQEGYLFQDNNLCILKKLMREFFI